MRYVVVGLGAIGGTIAARLSLSGQDVHGIARGAHLDAIQADGLLLRSPGGQRIARFPATDLAGYRYADGDAIVLAVKSQDTQTLLAGLAEVAPDGAPVLCAQNGVSNEPAAQRWFAHVYGVVVQCPAVHLHPGVVDVHSGPLSGVLDLGRHPGGEDAMSRSIAADWSRAGFASRSVSDIAAWKHAKLLGNLFNAVEVVCGAGGDATTLGDEVRAEGRGVLKRAGIAHRTADEERARVRQHLRIGEIDGPRPGSSMWQSVARGQGVEVDFLNGEIVRIARGTGTDAPLNRTLQRWAREVASGRRGLGATSTEAVRDAALGPRPSLTYE